MKKTISLFILSLLVLLPSMNAQQVINGNRVSVTGTGYQAQCTNDGTTGTTINLLAKATSTGCIKAAITDTNIPVWIVTSASATTGSASLAFSGQATCIMDATASSTEGFYVIASVTTAGDCHPQAALPTGAFIIGTLISNSTTATAVSTVQIVSSFNSAGGGGAGAQLYVFPIAGNIALSTSSACQLGLPQGNCQVIGNESRVQTPIPLAGTLKNMTLWVNQAANAQPASGSLVCTMRINGANTTLTITIAASATVTTALSDTTHTVAVNQLDLIDVACVNNATANSLNISGIAAIIQ